MLPDYLIIGAKRAGSTSLHRYLVQHPAVLAPNVSKGSHYFDVQFHQGWSWYRSHFPTILRRKWEEWSRRSRVLAGEASPYYVFHPLALERIKAALPSVKLILLLRDPVQRAYSHYQYEVARGFETEPIERALDLEPERLAGEVERMRTEPGYVSFEHRHHSYLARGVYVDQVERLQALFPSDQVLIMASEELFREPERAMSRVMGFLNLEKGALPPFDRHKANTYQPIEPGICWRLAQYYAEPNRRLYEVLGSDFGWTTPEAH